MTALFIIASALTLAAAVLLVLAVVFLVEAYAQREALWKRPGRVKRLVYRLVYRLGYRPRPGALLFSPSLSIVYAVRDVDVPGVFARTLGETAPLVEHVRLLSAEVGR